MVFSRRSKQSWQRRLGEWLWPRTGWLRAVSYMWHRLRRLPDPPHRIARGVAFGVFVSFTPFYGFHFLLAIGLSLLLRGNAVAAALATFVGNPLTFPLIATMSVELGAWMLDMPGGMPLGHIVAAFSQASLELWANFSAIFSPEPMRWERLGRLFDRVFLPYLVGGIVPGIVAGTLSYMATHRIVEAYQNRRIRKLKDKVEARRATRIAQAGDRQ